MSIRDIKKILRYDDSTEKVESSVSLEEDLDQSSLVVDNSVYEDVENENDNLLDFEIENDELTILVNQSKEILHQTNGDLSISNETITGDTPQRPSLVVNQTRDTRIELNSQQPDKKNDLSKDAEPSSSSFQSGDNSKALNDSLISTNRTTDDSSSSEKGAFDNAYNSLEEIVRVIFTQYEYDIVSAFKAVPAVGKLFNSKRQYLAILVHFGYINSAKARALAKVAPSDATGKRMQPANARKNARAMVFDLLKPQTGNAADYKEGLVRDLTMASANSPEDSSETV